MDEDRLTSFLWHVAGSVTAGLILHWLWGSPFTKKDKKSQEVPE